MTTAKTTTNGRVTIPKNVRDELGLKPGDRINFTRVGRFEYELRPEPRRDPDRADDSDLD